MLVNRGECWHREAIIEKKYPPAESWPASSPFFDSHELALYSNRFIDAEKHLRKAIDLPLPQLAGTNIRGIIGTELLYHLLTTLDYPEGQLILRRKDDNPAKQSQLPKASAQITVPFWMAGDHYMVAWGRVNDAPPALLFVDTGFSQGGFLCSESTLKQAGIKLQTADADNGGQSAADTHAPAKQSAPPEPQSNVPFIVDRLSLGDAREEKIKGLTGVFPASLENAFGFRIAGLISHQFLRPYAVTFDFTNMKIVLEKK